MRSLILIDFPVPKMEPESAHVYQLSLFTGSNVAIAMQDDAGNIPLGLLTGFI